jgi:hypothetical protein
MLIRTALFSVLVFAVGCASQTRSFNIEVHNNSSKPITLVLAKDAGPNESLWATPEEVSIAGVSGDGQWGIGVVPAGKTASSQKVVGTFPAGSNAFLRIYAGDLNLGDALKAIPGSPQRVDVPLQTGSNSFTVMDKEDGIAIDSGPAAAAAPATQPEAPPATQPATLPATPPAPAAAAASDAASVAPAAPATPAPATSVTPAPAPEPPK